MSEAASGAASSGRAAPVTTRVANLAGLLTRPARRFGDRPALIDGELSLSWRELDERSGAMAAALRDRFGVVKGDRVLVQSRNCHQMFESMFACFRLGAVWVPTNVRQTPDEVAVVAETSGATGMICNVAFPGHVDACRASASPPRSCVAIGEAAFGESYDALIEEHRGTSVTDAIVDRGDPCWFFFTSGTTGQPKASVLTHGQMAFVVINHLHDLMPGTGPDDVSLVVAPLSHGAGVHQLVQVAAGATTVLMPGERFNVPTAWSLVERYRVSNLFTVPTIVRQLVEHPSVASVDHSSLRHVVYAGAPMYREDQKRALQVLGPVLVQYFGLGEVTGNITVLPPDDHHVEDGPDTRIGSCGFARTGMEVSVQDEHGTLLDAGETGEIGAAGPALFAGYYRNSEANAKAFRDGWFRTGDLGHLDAEGYLYMIGIGAGQDRAPPTPPGMRVRTGRFEKLRSGETGNTDASVALRRQDHMYARATVVPPASTSTGDEFSQLP